MKFIKKILKIIRDLPKSIYVNFKCLPAKEAIYLPIRVRWNVKIGEIHKNSIKIDSEKLTFSMIELGYRGAKFISDDKMYLSIKENSQIIFHGKTILAEGFNIVVENGVISFGNNFYSNRNLLIQCNKSIKFGNDCLLGWNVSIRDTDGHDIINKLDNTYNDKEKEIIIENHVWVAADVTILKGSYINSNNIIACNTLIPGKCFKDINCVIAGNAGKVVKQNVDWKE